MKPPTKQRRHDANGLRLDIGAATFNELWCYEVDTLDANETRPGRIAFAAAMEDADPIGTTAPMHLRRRRLYLTPNAVRYAATDTGAFANAAELLVEDDGGAFLRGGKE